MQRIIFYWMKFCLSSSWKSLFFSAFEWRHFSLEATKYPYFCFCVILTNISLERTKNTSYSISFHSESKALSLLSRLSRVNTSSKNILFSVIYFILYGDFFGYHFVLTNLFTRRDNCFFAVQIYKVERIK